MAQQFGFHLTKISDLLEIYPFHAEDYRGGLIKDFSQEMFRMNGVSFCVIESLYISSNKGVIRGLHFQRIRQVPKLVRCISGHVWDVVVDLRKNSPTFKQWQGFDLSTEDNASLFIPSGCANGIMAIEPSIVSCKCGEKFYGEYDAGIAWNDPDIGIEWPLGAVGGLNKVVLSDKDKQLPSFVEFLNTYGEF